VVVGSSCGEEVEKVADEKAGAAAAYAQARAVSGRASATPCPIYRTVFGKSARRYRWPRKGVKRWDKGWIA
jgi:hypothetical protein